MRQPKAPPPGRKTRGHAGVAPAPKEKRGKGRASENLPPAPINPEDVTVASVIGEFEAIRRKAMGQGRFAEAMNATMAKAKFAGVNAADRHMAARVKFDGNYTEAARRIAFLLRLADGEKKKEKKVIEHKPKGDSDGGPS